MRETIRRNRVRNGLVYLQVSRGAGPREFTFPSDDVQPTVVCWPAASRRPRPKHLPPRASPCKTMPDMRWGRCDIKTVMLLPAALAKEAARKEGAKEAWLVDAKGYRHGRRVLQRLDRGHGQGRLITRQIDNAILRGVTRTTLIDLLEREKIELVERPFTVAEAKAAREAFITSATNVVMPVVRIDGQADRQRRSGAPDAKTASRISFGGGNRTGLIAGLISEQANCPKTCSESACLAACDAAFYARRG